MRNHFHVVLKTPQPNLSRGMQAFLSFYSNGWSRRQRFGGHVLAPMHGVSRPESVPSLVLRFGAWLATDRGVCKQLSCLEEQLEGSDSAEWTGKWVRPPGRPPGRGSNPVARSGGGKPPRRPRTDASNHSSKFAPSLLRNERFGRCGAHSRPLVSTRI
jgi:hypothetical protein